MKTTKRSSLKTNLKKIILDQSRLHPGFKVEDLYKLLSQAVFGGGHLLHHHALEMLQEEMANLPRFDEVEPLVESIDPKGIIYRINLRAYKKRGGVPEILFTVMQESAQCMKGKGNAKHFLNYWHQCEKLAGAGSIPFTEQTLVDFRTYFVKENLPVIHHSPAYMKASRPAYRIAVKKIIKKYNIQ